MTARNVVVEKHPERDIIGATLHKMFCKSSHIDMCAYHYTGKWADKAHEEWREKADRFMAVIEKEIADGG